MEVPGPSIPTSPHPTVYAWALVMSACGDIGRSRTTIAVMKVYLALQMTLGLCTVLRPGHRHKECLVRYSGGTVGEGKIG